MKKQKAIAASFLMLFSSGVEIGNAAPADIPTTIPAYENTTETVLPQFAIAQGPATKDGERPRIVVESVAGRGSVPLGIDDSFEKKMWARLSAGRNATDNAIKQTPGATKGYAFEYLSEKFDGRIYEVVCDVVVW